MLLFKSQMHTVHGGDVVEEPQVEEKIEAEAKANKILEGSRRRKRHNAVADKDKLWPGGRVPVVLMRSAKFTTTECVLSACSC